MTTLTKTLLAMALTGFAVGGVVDFTNLTENPAWTVALPVGAIFFGLFMISKILEKEMALFDAEAAGEIKLPKQISAAAAPAIQKPGPQPGVAAFKLKPKTA